VTLWCDPYDRAYDSELLRALLEVGDSYIDVGANIGHLAIEAAVAVGPTGSVTAFEGHPRVAAYIRENVDLNQLDNVAIAQFAAGERFGWVAFSDLKSDDQNRVDARGQVKVTMAPIDPFCPSGAVKLLKVDVEGFELFVFRGAKEVLMRTSFVYFEFWDNHTQELGYSFSDIFDLLKQHGFTIGRVEGLTARPVEREDRFPSCVNLLAWRDSVELQRLLKSRI